MKPEHFALFFLIAIGGSQCMTNASTSSRLSSVRFDVQRLRSEAAEAEARDKVLLTEVQKACKP